LGFIFNALQSLKMAAHPCAAETLNKSEFPLPEFTGADQMSIDGKLLEILCCPVSKSPLARLERSRLEKLNRAITAGEVLQIDGNIVTDTLREALITEDGKVIYPVIDDIPVLLSERGIGTTQLQDF
jgi:uncharacterized protein YbaR (Trm112 family)